MERQDIIYPDTTLLTVSNRNKRRELHKHQEEISKLFGSNERLNRMQCRQLFELDNCTYWQEKFHGTVAQCPKCFDDEDGKT